MIWSVELLPYAVQEVPDSQVFDGGSADSWRHFHFYVVLLRSSDVNVLIDCGMDDPGPLNKAIYEVYGSRGAIRSIPGVNLKNLLLDRGLKPQDIDLLALTHLHADHSGNIAQLETARLLVSTTGWHRYLECLRKDPSSVGPPEFPDEAVQRLRSAQNEDRLLAVDSGGTPIDGLTVQYVGGHTVDSTAYVVETRRGDVVIPGDTIWTYDNLERDIAVGHHIDLDECYATMAWTRDTGGLVLPSHDSSLMERFPSGSIA